jgi:hypothetical protein
MRKKLIVNSERGTVVAIWSNNKHKVKGIAKCNMVEGDKFDSEVGKQLAEGRASLAHQKAQRQEYLKKIQSFLKQAETFQQMLNKINIEIGISERNIEKILEKLD